MVSNTTSSHVRSPTTISNNDPNSNTFNEVVLKHSTLLDEHFSLASSICEKLHDTKCLYEGIENTIQFPFIQQTLSVDQHRVVVEEVLDGSLNLLNLCAFISDVLCSMKESTMELESCLRRRNDCKEGIHAYLMSRRKIHRMVSKFLKNLQALKYEKGHNCIKVLTTFQEAQTLGLSTLKNVLAHFSRSKGKRSGWSLVALLKNSKQEDGNELEKIDQIIFGIESKKTNIDIKMAQDLSKQLASLELAIFEFEECLGAISRCLLKIRVSLLNILSR